MKVTRIAQTYFSGYDYYGPEFPDVEGVPWKPERVGQPEHSDSLGEFAGRACYESWDRPNPKTASNEGYLKHILDVEHYSVLAHASVTFYIQDVSRALTHELIRSRFLAFSQKSQRYVDEQDTKLVMPPLIEKLGPHSDAWRTLEAAYFDTQRAYQQLVEELEYEAPTGTKRKEIREAARAILPNATATSIVVSGNLRAYRDFIQQRHTMGADAEIRELAGELLKQLRVVVPNSFQDIPEEPYE